MRPLVAWLAAAGLAASAVVTPAAGQDDDLAATCAASVGSASACYLAAGAIRTIQPRLGLALWGGSPVPGSASTLGMRLGSTPRLSVSTRLMLVPTTLPPLLDRSTGDAATTLLPGVSAQGTIGLLGGWSPLPTMGGVLSLDALLRVSWAPLPTGRGFHDGAVWGWQAGLRLGALRESLTLPGISITGAYARSTGVAFGDPAQLATDGYFDGAVSDLSATAAVTRTFSALGLTAGVAWDRYGSGVDLGYRTSLTGVSVRRSASARTVRWSGFVDAAWTWLIFHGSAELGWQQAPVPDGLPPDVSVRPVGWWAGVAFRLSL